MEIKLEERQGERLLPWQLRPHIRDVTAERKIPEEQKLNVLKLKTLSSESVRQFVSLVLCRPQNVSEPAAVGPSPGGRAAVSRF